MSERLDRSGYELELEEDFTHPVLDPDRWVAHYLPHWTTPERSAARYELRPGLLRLRIEADQPAWRLAEAVLRASADPACMLAFWLVGFEEASPEQSGEICVCELFGNAVGPGRSGARIGVKAHGDPRLRQDMEEVLLDVDATDWHAYAAEWTAERIRFFVDDRLVREVRQRIDYPLQLMIDLFEFPEGGDRDPAAYPKIGDVRAVRGYRSPAG